MLKETHRIYLKAKLLSGMHITGSEDTFDIGGADSQVIKNPLTGEPYIPGSTLKGKLRSLLEFKYGHFQYKNEQGIILKEPILKVGEEYNKLKSLFEPVEGDQPQMTRCIFRDMCLTKESKSELNLYLGENVYTEIKAENKINRFKGKAESPRFIERVPAGSVFEGYIDILEFEDDDYSTMLKYLKEAIEMLNMNFIGGSGSRGYGRVEITWKELDSELK